MVLYSASLFIFALLSHAACLQDGDVRLANSSSSDPSRGRVEVFDDGNWTSICFNHEAIKDQDGVGQAVCRQLGKENKFEVGTVSQFKLPEGTHKNKLANGACLYQVDPQNAAQHVYRCLFVGGECGHEDDMAVDCISDVREDHPYDTMVDFLNDDLPNEMSLSEGIAQVYVNQEWGPVCNMQKADADVFCRQLSFTNAVSVQERAGRLPNLAVVDKFHCKDDKDEITEACLSRCFDYPSQGKGVNCSQGHSFVVCEFKKDAQDELLGAYGTKSICTSTGSNSGAVAGAVMGVLLAITAIIIATGVIYYFLFYRKRTGRVFLPGSSTTKYDAI